MGFPISSARTILSLAVFGTLIATFVTGYLLSLTGVLNTMECYVYAALISAVDPVSTLSVFKKVDAPHRYTQSYLSKLLCLLRYFQSWKHTLFNVVFGESVLNDAVAIVLYGIFLNFAQSTDSKELFIIILLICFIGHFRSHGRCCCHRSS